MSIAFGGVEDEIADPSAGDVEVFGGDVGEDDAGGDVLAGPEAGGVEEVVFAQVGEAEEPEDGVGDAGEDAEPGAESGWVDLWRGMWLVLRNGGIEGNGNLRIV